MSWDHSKSITNCDKTLFVYYEVNCTLTSPVMLIMLLILMIFSGYIAPEYLYRDEISTMLDIYSLGLLIIETSTGEKNIPKQNEPSAREFIKNIRKNLT